MSPDFLPPARCGFSHARKGKTAEFQRNPSTKAIFPFSRGKNRISHGVENRGSLISVPLALREETGHMSETRQAHKLKNARLDEKGVSRLVSEGYPVLCNGREVLHGVGADGVGVKFPIFAVNCCCLPLSFRRSRAKRRKRGKMRKKRGKNA